MDTHDKQKFHHVEGSGDSTPETSTTDSSSEVNAPDPMFEDLNSAGTVQGAGGLPVTVAKSLGSKFANNMNGWLKEVVQVEYSSEGSNGIRSELSEPSSVSHVESNSKHQNYPQSSTEVKIDPHFYNAVASFQDIANSGPPADPPDFPDPTYTDAIRISASVYNPETDEEIIVPNVMYEVRPDGPPPKKAYWVGRQLKTAIYGCVCACSILKVREGGGVDLQGNALWEVTPELAAVKIIDIGIFSRLNSIYIENPMKEMAAMQYCSKNGSEPNLLECYDLYRDEKYVYMFMPYCSKGELFSWVKSNGRFEESTARYWFKQLLSALISLQKNGICHRDISLENIMINENTHALVIDLGMCLRVPFKSSNGCRKGHCSTRDSLRTLIFPQGKCGKRNYTSPEILMNSSPFDGYAIDIWAMGVILFIMLVGVFPFEWASSDEPRYSMVTSGKLNELLARWNRSISPLAVDLLQALLKENPRDRLSLFEIMNHPWVMVETAMTKEVLENLKPHFDDDMDCD